jgi:hypothetical protein
MLRDQSLSLPILLLVRDPQKVRHGNSSQAHCERDRESGRILWLLAIEVDVASHDTAHIAHTDEQCHTHRALATRRKRVRDPRYEDDEGAVEAAGDGEEEAVCETWIFGMRDSELSDKAARCEGEAGYDKRRPRAHDVGPPGERHSKNSGEDVDGNCEELSVGCGVAETVDDGWYGGGEAADQLVAHLSSYKS